MGLFKRRTSKEEDADIIKEGEKEKVKWSKRPANTAFKQQRLKAWQPILTPTTVLPTFFLIGLIFLPLGGILLYGSSKVKDFTIDYTQCEFVGTPEFAPLPTSAYEYNVGPTPLLNGPTWSYTTNTAAGANVSTTNLCRLQFELPSDMVAPVFMYYKLTNYFQNHRRYVRSVDIPQLQGQARTFSQLSGGDCAPVATEGNLPVYPCGLIANSVFNDTFLQPVLINPLEGTSAISNQTYNMTSKGIVWPGEPSKYGTTAYNYTSCAPPPFWAKRYPNGYTADGPTAIPILSQDEHFLVWMRTAGLPTFRKLYFRNDNEDLKIGRYQIDIFMNYPVAPFRGTKSIVFSTVSFIGGKNPFLGIAYLVVGGLCMLLGLGLTLRHLIRPRKLGDMRYLSWNLPENEVKK